MISSKLKIFHGLVNYGTQAGLFAQELRNQGIEAISVGFYDKYKRLIDVELKHGGNLFQKITRHTWNLFFKIKCMFSYNIFHFYYGQTLLPKQLDLYYYKLTGKKVVFHYLGGDVDTYPSCKNVDYGGRKIDNRKKIRRLKHETRFASVQFVCAPYYMQFVKNSVLIPLAIDLEKYIYTPLLVRDEIIILHAPTNRQFKKSDIIEDAINRLISEGFKIKYNCITNVSHNQLMKEYMSSDLIIDQLNFGYGTVSIEAMALGRPVIVGIDKESHQNVNLYNALPTINADTDNIYEVLKETLINKHKLPEIGYNSRKFIEEYHDIKKLTHKLVAYYKDF